MNLRTDLKKQSVKIKLKNTAGEVFESIIFEELRKSSLKSCVFYGNFNDKGFMVIARGIDSIVGKVV